MVLLLLFRPPPRLAWHSQGPYHSQWPLGKGEREREKEGAGGISRRLCPPQFTCVSLLFFFPVRLFPPFPRPVSRTLGWAHLGRRKQNDVGLSRAKLLRVRKVHV